MNPDTAESHGRLKAVGMRAVGTGTAAVAVALGIGATVVAGGTGIAAAAPAEDSSSTGTLDSGSDAPVTRTGRSRMPVSTRVAATRGETLPPDREGSLASRSKTSKDSAPVGAARVAERSPSLVAVGVPAAFRSDPPATRTTAKAVVPTAATQHGNVPAPAPGLVTWVSAASWEPGPAVPVESPISWTVLAVTRRQFGRLGDPASAAVAVSNAVTNQPPVISQTVLTGPNVTTGAITGTVKATDPDGDRLTYAATTSAKGAVSINTSGVFTYTPTAMTRHAAAKAGATAATTTDIVTVTVTDARGVLTTSTVTVPISPKNTVPTGKATVGTPNGTTGVISGSIAGTDADKDSLAYSAPATTAKGAVAINAVTGAFTYTPNATARHNASGTSATAADKSDSFTVTVTDGYGGSVGVPVTVVISPANTAPTATGVVGAPNPITGVVSGRVAAVDAEKDTLTYKPSKPANGAVVINTDGTFTYTPTVTARASARSATTTKTDSFTVTVTDAHGGTATVTLTPTIAPTDSAPIAGTPALSTNPSTGVVTGTVNATDPDKDTISYTATTIKTAKGSVTVTGAGAFTYTPTATARHAAAKADATAATVDSFSVTAVDKYGAMSTITVSVPVKPVDTAPVVGKVTAGTPNAVTGVVSGTVTATDADQDAVSFSAPSITAKGTVSINSSTGAFTYTPTARARDAAAAQGATATDRVDSFTVTVNDGYGGTTTVAVPVSISPEALIGYGGAGEGGVTWEDPAGRVVEVQTHLIVDRVAPTGLNFFALQVTFANQTPNEAWAHGGPQFNDGSKWLANWGGLASGYNDINWARDLLLMDSGEDKPNTVPWQWDLGREYILTISRGDKVVLPAGVNTAHDNVLLPERTMWVWNFSIVPVDGKGQPFTSRLFAAEDSISWYIMFNESGYGSTSDQQHTRWSIPVYRVEGSADYQHPAWGSRDQHDVF